MSCRPKICEVIKCGLHPCWSVLCGPCSRGRGLDMRGLLMIVWPLAALTWGDLVESTQAQEEKQRGRVGIRLFSAPSFFRRWARRLGVQNCCERRSVKKIGGEMLTKSYKIRSLINFRILNEPKAAVVVEGLCWRSHFLWQSSTLTGSAKLRK